MPGNEHLEIFKLDDIDRKVVFFHILPESPKSLRSYIDHIAKEYKESKGVELDRSKLLQELLNPC